MIPDLLVTARPRATCGELTFGALTFPCALGRAGLVAAKREGDGATPIGRFVVRRVLFRPDRLAAPLTHLPVAPIQQSDGWCDDPALPQYNRPVTLPFSGSHELMWRDDHLYDLVVVLGHNDDPPLPGAGSAIFMHVAKMAAEQGPGRDAPESNLQPTEGCVALSLDALKLVVAGLRPDTMINIRLGQADADAGRK